MDDQLKQGKMGPPAIDTQPNPNQNQINAGNNNNTNKISQPLSKRIINKIPLDFNKLKQAGLDRKLAEAISKRNFSATSKIDKIEVPQQSIKSSPSSLSSSTTSSTLASISGEAATSILMQPQQPQQEKATTSQMSQRQPAPQPIKKRSIMSNYIEKIVPDTARSLHVKAMLKNRILSKGKSLLDQPDSGGTTYIYQTPSTTIVTPSKMTPPTPSTTIVTPSKMTPPTPSTSASTSSSISTLKNSTPPADFTVPIAKADLTVRPKKAPVVLNSLNQLPKQRVKCLQTPTASNPPAPYTEPNVKPAPSPSGKSPSPPLIVLENKVLAPNEKIKLSDLRLPSRSMAVTSTNSSGKLILNVDKPKVTQKNIAELDKKISNKPAQPNVAPIVTVTSPPSVSKTKVILNANKLKVSREKLAEMAKKVRQQIKQVGQKPKISVEPPSYQSIPTSSSTVLEPLQPGQPVQQEAQVDESLFSEALSAPTSAKSLISPTDSVSPSYQQLTLSTPASAPLPNCESLVSDLNTSLSPSVSAAGTGSSGSLISPILVPSEDTPPSESAVVPCTSSPKIFSAVDLIAQLTAQDPNYENSFMELSPEELQMSLHFGYTQPLRKVPSEAKSESKEDLPIGKILKIQDIDILHATMDIDGEKANVLRISPNAIKLQNNGEPMQTEEEDPKLDKDVESKIVLTGEPNTLRVTKINQKSDKEAKQKLKLGETIKTVKMKKAEINLVSRKKKVLAIKSLVEMEHTQNGHEDQRDEREMMDEESSTTSESQHNEKKTDEEPKNDVLSDGDKSSTVDTTVHQLESILPKSSRKRDLTQLYHPPKMPKLKHNSNNNNNNNNIINESPPPASNVSLIDILTQEPPPTQGEAQVPFRKEPDPEPEPKPELKPQPEESKPSDAVGIKNLLNHLKAENISPQSKSASNITSPSIVTSKSPTGLDKSAKAVPRKKLVKTRPFLAKRNSKSTTKEEQTSTPPTAVFPRNGSLLGDIQTNGTSNHVTSSSTSDDDAMFLGFPNAEGKSSKGKRVKHLKAKETDISDDATPDYDETEGEDQPKLPHLLEEKPKTDVEMEESKDKSVMKDSSLLEQEESNSLDSNQSWTTPMETEEIAAKETSEEVPVNETTASVIVYPKETKDVSIPQDSAIENQTIEPNDEVPVKETEPVISSSKDTEDAQESAIENQTIVEEESVEKVLPAVVKTLEDSPALQESVITNEQMDKRAAPAKTECVSPLKPLDGSLIKSKKKSQKNKKEPEELEAPVENNSDIKDSTKDKSKLVTKEESLKLSPKSKNIPSKKGKVSSDELEVKPKDETSSTSKKNNKVKFQSELGIKESPTVDSGTNKSNLNPLEENATVIETSSECPLTKEIDVNVSKEKDSVAQKPAEESAVDDRPSVISYLVKGHRKSQSPAKAAKVIEQNDIEIPASDLSLNDSQIATDAEAQKEDLNDSAAPLVSPRKRGRKPKSRKLENPLVEKLQIDEQADKQSEVLNEESNPSAASPLVTPKRRGRKPRNTEEPLASTVKIADQSDIAASIAHEELNPPLITPKKRGRKPKPRISVEFLDDKPHSSDQINEKITEVTEDEPNPSPEPLVVPKKRGRKPKPRISDDFVYDKPQTMGQIREQATIVMKDKSNLVSEPLVIPKKRGRKSKSHNPDESGDEKLPTTHRVNEQSDSTNLQKEKLNSFTVPLDIPKKQGRRSIKSEEEPAAKKPKITEPSKANVNSVKILPSTSTSVPQNVFNLRLLLIRKREQLNTEEELRQEGKGSGPLKCGLCLARSSKADWQRHLGQHYGVGWITDNMPEFVTRSTIINEMNSYLRDNKPKGLICRICGRKLASGLGMVGHLEGCGLMTPQRLECPYCKRMYTKLSLIQHQRCCARRQHPLEAAESKIEKKKPVEPKKTVYSNSGRAKRNSSIKAETKLKKIRVDLQAGDDLHTGKDFDADSSDYDVTKDHESSVEYESDGVVSSLGDSEDPVKRRSKPSRQSKPSARSKNIFSRNRDVGVLANEKWDQFIESNYAIDPLNTDYLPSYVNLSMDEANDLLNSRQTYSMRFAYDKVENECDWRQLKPLEGINAQNDFITYLGAPVTQLEWVPLPPTIDDQYLMCSLRRKMHGYTRYTDSRRHSALMMLLKCTVDSGSESTEFWPLKTTLHYGIRVPKGPVFSFAFMPSGGYMESSNRLGLLALATSLCDVQIYALPLQLTDKEKMNDSEDSVIELNSVVTLRLDMNGTIQDQCTKVCWSEGLGHSLLVSGYASGNVALWEIGDTEGLNCFKSNNHCSFVPLHYFYFGERNIGILNLHYDLSGPRWLAVGTSTRKMRVYDLINCSQPTPLMGDEAVTNFFKGCISWPPIWETISLGCSSVFQIRFTRLLVSNPCGIMFTTKTLDYVLYSARDIHYNCQDNIIIVVTENGDLVFLNPRELNMEPVIHKLSYNCRAVSVTELSKLNGEQPTKDSSITANDFQRDYGVIVKPLTAVPKQKKDAYLKDSRRPSNELLTMTRLNVVRSNSNRAAQSWVAVGAEHGMLRILNFQRDKFF